MKAYPVELRERVVAAVDQQHGTVSEIAQIFGVTERYVYKLLKQRHERDDLSPLPHGGGARPKLSEEKKGKVVALVARGPDATLAELREEIKKKLRVEVSMGTAWNLLDSLGLTRKKRPAALVRPTLKRERLSRRSNGRWRVAG
jgi:transposase